MWPLSEHIQLHDIRFDAAFALRSVYTQSREDIVSMATYRCQGHQRVEYLSYYTNVSAGCCEIVLRILSEDRESLGDGIEQRTERAGWRDGGGQVK